MFWFADLSNHFVDKFDNCLVDLMSHIDSFDHFLFFDLVCACLDHDNFLGSRCNSQLKISVIPVSLRRVYNEFAVYHTDLCSCTRSAERNIGNTCCDSRTKHCKKLRTALRINAHYHVI